MSLGLWLSTSLVAASSSVEPTSGTVPLTFEMDSPVVSLTMRTKAGAERPARFLVDTGGGGLLLTEELADELGLKIEREAAKVGDGGSSYAPVETPRIEIGGMPLDLAKARCLAVLDGRPVLHGCTVEAFFPGHVLAAHHVVFDYPGRTFTLARPGSAKPRGVRVPSPIEARSGFPRIELEVDGETHGFLLDSGASFTMISRDLLQRWRTDHPELRGMIGAVGVANMTGGEMETQALVTRLPEMLWADFTLDQVVAVSRPGGTFEKYMSSMMTAPVVGALGGNVLKHFRVEIDYANGATWLETDAGDFATRLDGVGLVLRETAEGRHRVDGIARELESGASSAAPPDPASAPAPVARSGPEPGDLLLKVDGVDVTGLRHRPLIDLLFGQPGRRLELTLDRGGKIVVFPVSISRFLAGE